MAVTYGFFNSVNGDRKYNAEQMSEYFRGIINEGVYQHLDGGLAVTAGTGLAVNVAAGRAIIQNRWIQNSAAMSLTIAAASETYARKDAVVIRLNWSSRAISIAVKTGTPAASPVAPSMTRNSTTYEMALAYVNVAANATSVTVTDKRSDSTVCGWVSVAQSTSGEVDAQLNAMKTGFDGVVYDSPVEMVQGCDEFIASGYGIKAHAIDPTKIKGVSGVMQYCVGVLNNKAIDSNANIVNSAGHHIYLFTKGFGWVVSTDCHILKVDSGTLAKVSLYKNPNFPQDLNSIDSGYYAAVDEEGFDSLDWDYITSGILPGTEKKMDIPRTNFSTSTYASGVNTYGGGYKAFAPFRYTGTIKITGTASGGTAYEPDGSSKAALSISGNQVTVNDKIVVIYSNDIANTSLSFPGVGYQSQIDDLNTEVKNIENGSAIKANSINPAKIKGVDGVFKYCVGIMANKTINSGANIVDAQNHNIYLFEKGFGWVVSAQYQLYVDRTTLAKTANAANQNQPFSLANSNIESGKYLAVDEDGFDYINFDYLSAEILPGTKKLTDIPRTLFSTYNYNNGINSYNQNLKAFAPFRLNGTVKITGTASGASYYNLDGSLGGSLSVVNNAVTASDKIVVIYSSDIANTSIEFATAEYEFSGKQCSVFGDSLTADAPYYPYLAKLTGLAIKNCGVGGTRVSGDASNAMWQDVRVNTLEGDFIVIMGGTNDCQYAQPGTESLDNIDTDTFIGAYNVMLSKIYYRYKQSTGYYQSVDYTGVTQLTDAQFPNIILVTPPKMFGSENAYNKSGEFGGYVKKIASWWGLPVVDAWNNMQMSWANKSYFFADNDPTHYNTHGRSKLGSLIAGKFVECYANFNDQV